MNTKPPRPTIQPPAELEVLHKAVEVLRHTTGLPVKVQPVPAMTNAGVVNEHIIIGPMGEGEEHHFQAVIMPVLTRATLGIAIQRLNLFQGDGVLVTRYITPPLAEELRGMNIQFLDTTGNAFLNALPLYVFVKGNRLEQPRRAVPVNRAFRPAGLQVIFALLCNPGLENLPFREIARVALVALGTVGWVMKDLKEMGYLVDMGQRGRRLTNKAHLLERWITAYPEQLRPKQAMGRFTVEDRDWWKKINIRAFQAYWGGEIAAAMLTQYLKPQMVTIYVAGPPAPLIVQNKMKKHPDGPIEVMTAFWNFAATQTQFGDLVPPLLIYADLLASGDPRNIETARLIHDQALTGLIREN